ncbi:MAG TPA: MBL fold metallo-hydrolase RNA specificity domain-containing protein, partial [Pelobium sp.]|nr:MBL fold metallo-hydrolase RNA specificity domain-containing protein [Pelobium sp.]
RIQDHIFRNIENFYATLFFIGFCAKGTLGHKLLRGDSFVNIKGKELSVMATIRKTDLLSGHGDHSDIMEYVSKIPNRSLKRVFLVHGERESMEALKVNLELNKIDVAIPQKGVCFEL